MPSRIASRRPPKFGVGGRSGLRIAIAQSVASAERRALHRDRAARAEGLDQLAAERRAAHHARRPDRREQALRAAELRGPDDLRDRAEGRGVGERARDADREGDGEHEPLGRRARDRPERHARARTAVCVECAAMITRLRLRRSPVTPAKRPKSTYGTSPKTATRPAVEASPPASSTSHGSATRPTPAPERVEQLCGEEPAPVAALEEALARAHAASTRRTRGWPWQKSSVAISSTAERAFSSEAGCVRKTSEARSPACGRWIIAPSEMPRSPKRAAMRASTPGRSLTSRCT